MTRFVLDCSVTMAWCFEDEADRYSDAVLAAPTAERAIVPSLWSLEVVNVLVVSERQGRLSREDGQRFLELLGGLPITVSSFAPEPAEVMALARGHRLSAYDAAYLSLALRMSLPIAARDRPLRAAARATRVMVFTGT